MRGSTVSNRIPCGWIKRDYLEDHLLKPPSDRDGGRLLDLIVIQQCFPNFRFPLLLCILTIEASLYIKYIIALGF